MTRRAKFNRGRRAKPIPQKAAVDLLPGDVIYWDGGRVVVLEASSMVLSAPPDAIFGRTQALHCCEPRVGYLSENGRLTHRATHMIVPQQRKFLIAGKLDLETPRATVEDA